MADHQTTAIGAFKPGDRVRHPASLSVGVVREVIEEDHPLGAWVICDNGCGRACVLEKADG